MAPGRIPRRGRVLRAVRVPDHLDPGDRVVDQRPGAHRALLRTTGPAIAPGPHHDVGHGRSRHRRGGAGRVAAAAGRCCRRADLQHELDADHLAAVVLRAARPTVATAASVVARRRGAVLSALASRPRRVPQDRRPAPSVADHACRHRRLGCADGLVVRVLRRSGPGLLRQRHARQRIAGGGGSRSRDGPAATGPPRPPAGTARGDRQQPELAARCGRVARRRGRGVLRHAHQLLRDGALPRRIPARCPGIGRDRAGGRPARHSDRAAARGAAAVLDRRPLVRHLSLALAGIHAQPAATGLPLGRPTAHGAARRADGRARRPVLPVHRASDPYAGFRRLRPVRAAPSSPRPLGPPGLPDRLARRARADRRPGRGVTATDRRYRVGHPNRSERAADPGGDP